MDYDQFIKGKAARSIERGFTPHRKINHGLYPFQAHVVEWAVKLGRAALFLDTGLGKTRCQVEWAQLVHEYTGGAVLILCPLAVAQQTIAEAKRIGIDVSLARDSNEIGAPGIYICNYESLHKIDNAEFAGVVLDESSILKNFTGAIKRKLIERFEDTEFKLCCTATPSPNDFMELGNHSQFLGVMDSNEMLSRFFINDTMKAGGYRLKRHGEDEFWRWVSSWAACCSNPADIGFNGDGFRLPKLEFISYECDTSDLPPVEGELFRDAALSATTMHKELRITAPIRAKETADIVNSSSEQYLVWVNTNYDADELRGLIPDAVEVRGSDSIQVKEKTLNAFSSGEARVLITKPSIAGFGMNWQQCRNVVFNGLGYSYEMFYQAIRRCWRYGQKHSVKVHLILADSERGILGALRRKEKDHDKMKGAMVKAINDAKRHGELVADGEIKGVATGPGWDLYLGDCVHVCRSLPEESIGFSVYSPPFSNLYIYSDNLYDMGNTADDAEFYAQYEELARELYRITKSGRLTCMHVKDLPCYKNRDGAAGLRDFPGECIRAFERAGWQYHSRVTIWKDPVIEMQRTKNHGLLYKQLCKDSAASRQGMADYLIVLRKWGDESKWDSVTRGEERFFDYIGATQCAPGQKEVSRGRSEKEKQRLYSIAVWQRYASPVWFDIRQTNVLNIQQAREGNDEKHIAPLQLDVIERAVELWSNPGDVVFSPFTGIGSEGYVSVKMGRQFKGAELKRSYWDVARKNLEGANAEQHDLFQLQETI